MLANVPCRAGAAVFTPAGEEGLSQPAVWGERMTGPSDTAHLTNDGLRMEMA